MKKILSASITVCARIFFCELPWARRLKKIHRKMQRASWGDAEKETFLILLGAQDGRWVQKEYCDSHFASS